jgi:hypothetical protein
MSFYEGEGDELVARLIVAFLGEACNITNDFSAACPHKTNTNHSSGLLLKTKNTKEHT